MTTPLAYRWTGDSFQVLPRHAKAADAAPRKGDPCTIDGCGRPVVARGWCKRHYDRWRRHGNPDICLKPLSARGDPAKWLRENCSRSGDECLIWPFAKFPDGRAHMNGAKPTRLMCELAHGKPPSSRHEAAHSCGKGHEACINPVHLRWATPVENQADRVQHGTLLMGSRLPQSKLTEDDVLQIRALSKTMQQKEIATLFNVGKTCIHKILKGVSWRHVA